MATLACVAGGISAGALFSRWSRGKSEYKSILTPPATIDLIHDAHNLCTRLRTDRIKAMSRGFAGGRHVINFSKKIFQEIAVEFVYSLQQKMNNFSLRAARSIFVLAPGILNFHGDTHKLDSSNYKTLVLTHFLAHLRCSHQSLSVSSSVNKLILGQDTYLRQISELVFCAPNLYLRSEIF